MTGPQGGGRTERFVQEALAQAGDRYVFGGETRPDDANPSVFDCSELVQWAAHRAGVDVSDGSWLQYLQLQQQGGAISVEQALHTRGALLFYFSDPPTRAGRPRTAHVAISLGDGRTIEARSTADGVGSFAATAKRFNYAATIPGLSTADPTPPADDPAPGADVRRAAAAAYTIPDAPPPGAGPEDTAPAGTTPTDTGPTGTTPTGTGPTGTAPTDTATTAAAGGDAAQSDADADGLTARFEALLGTDPLDPDSDDDGLTDAQETAVDHTDPRDPDTDDDGRSDAEEVAAGTSPGTAALPQAAVEAGFGGLQTLDTDQDGLSDLLERRLGTRPDVADSDSDSLQDGVEEAIGSNPLSIDTNRDGVTDDVEFEAGTLGPGPSGTTGTDPADALGPAPAADDLHADLGAGLDHPI